MNDIERETQRRVIALFRDELGYRFLGNWYDPGGIWKYACQTLQC